jgi:cysteinyl-tRNA synthetase
LEQYTEKYIQSFFKDIETLNIIPADHYPRATAHIPEMVQLIKSLQAKGYAYEKDGSYYFDISKFPDYGKLAKINVADLKSGHRVDGDDYEKENIHDFALWKKNKEGEPFWDTELGKGRPGWHIECSAMSSKYLGETFDIHCGGVDNIFPHHENEIAQSEASSGKKFVKYWLHCHHLIVDGDKMSKSKGNFYTLTDLLNKQVDPMALRLLLLSTHYRKLLNFTFEALAQAESALQRIKDFLYELKNTPLPQGENEAVLHIIQDAKNKFTAGLSDDLNVSKALTAVFESIKKANILLSRGEVFDKDAENLTLFIRNLNEVLGLLPKEEESMLSHEIQSKIDEREKARKDKNYSLADKIRDDLLNQGIILEDTKDGVRWKYSSKPKP